MKLLSSLFDSVEISSVRPELVEGYEHTIFSFAPFDRLRANGLWGFCLLTFIMPVYALYDFSTINVSGFYKLAANVSDQITISTSNVTLDLNGHTVSGGTNGIVINSNLNNITIKNGTIDSVTLDGVQVNSGCSAVLLSNLVVENALVGLSFDTCSNSFVRNCDMHLNTTGIQLDTCANISVAQCISRANTQAGYDLLSTLTCSFIECKALSCGDGNGNASGNQASVFGFVSRGGYGNLFEKCIANSTQNLNATDDRVVIAGFALRDGEGCSKIIECEASNGATNAGGNTVPYGIWLEGTFDSLTTLTEVAAVDGIHRVYDVSWSPDGQYFGIASFFSADTVQLFSYDYELNKAQFIVSADISTFSNAYTVAWHPAGDLVAYSGGTVAGVDEIILAKFDRSNQTLKIIDTASYSGNTNDDVLSINWSADGNYLAVGGVQSSSPATAIAKAYELDRIALRLTERGSILTTAAERCLSVHWSPDGNYLAIGNRGSAAAVGELAIYAFDKTTKTFLLVTSVDFGSNTTTDNADAVAWSIDGNYIAILGASTTTGLRIYAFDGTSLTLKDTVAISGQTSASGYHSQIAWSPDGRFLAVAGIVNPTNETHVYYFDRDSEQWELAALFTDTALSYGVSWSPDGSVLAIGRASDSTYNVYMLTGIQYPQNNLIMNNVVYCNSGGKVPMGVGIYGSSIQNMILQNSSFDNPFNYIAVTNVFNQFFGNGPTLLQNITVDSNDPISSPMDIPAQVQRVNLLLESLVDNLL